MDYLRGSPIAFFSCIGRDWVKGDLAARAHEWTLISSSIFSSLLLFLFFSSHFLPIPFLPLRALPVALLEHQHYAFHHSFCIFCVSALCQILGWVVFDPDAQPRELTCARWDLRELLHVEGRCLWEWRGAGRSMEMGSGEEKGWGACCSQNQQEVPGAPSVFLEVDLDHRS